MLDKAKPPCYTIHVNKNHSQMEVEFLTKQFKKRAAILSCLRGTKSHPSAEMVYEMLRAENPDISLATVYRNLTLFKNQGLIRSLGTVDGVERFDGRVEPHVHFVCTGCDAVTDLDNVVLPQAVLQEAQSSGNQVADCQLTFTGLCQKCQKVM